MDTEHQKLAPVLLGIHLVALPLYQRMPVYIVLLVVLLTAWSLLIIAGRMKPPKKIIRLMLVGAVVFALIISYGRVFGQGPGTSMLLLLSFLKLFEMKDKRDVIIVIFMGYFLTASTFFHTQSPWVAVYVFVVATYLTSLLIGFSDRLGSTDFKSRFRLSLRMITLAVPMMLILFVLVPRVPGPLWALPNDAKAAKTGISEEMSPGSISSLISSGAVAFRVKFDGKPPAHEDLYWRGLVLSRYDGKKWTRDDAPGYTRPEVTFINEQVDIKKYVVTLEPHGQRWLYSLETMIDFNRLYRTSRELQVFTNKTVNDVVIYEMTSNLDVFNHGLYPPERRKNLVLPEGFNNKTKKLAQRLMAHENNDEQKFVDAVLGYFRNGEFYYTLSPALLGRDAMDDFLFNTRQGFCEHYASAFVYLMRAGGLPARVIVGYQGGSLNPVDDYMIVRQSDAHAWAEVWFSNQGWVRVDPTAAVSPGRVEHGIQSAGVEMARLPSILVSGNALFLKARYFMDSFHNSWNQWVVGFNDKKQKELFNRLGFDDVSFSTLVALLVVSMTIFGGVLALWIFHCGSKNKHDKARYYYDVFCNKLEKISLKREPFETPGEYLLRISALNPSVKTRAEVIIGHYQDLRYGDDKGKEEYFVRCVKQFKVKTTKR